MKIVCVLSLLFATLVMAQESSSETSSSSYLAIPEGLADELTDVAMSGFSHGFGIATAFLLGAGGVALFMHLINRGAGH